LRRLRCASALRHGRRSGAGLGAGDDVATAIDEIRLRYCDATQGVPNETRQPFRDGSTDFERILPGPDRMYPDTDSPPTRITRQRVERLEAGLAARPWTREDAYGKAGVPTATIRYLIRRGGARLVDRVVAEAGASLRRACFLFGERLKGLARRGVAVERIPGERWSELFRLAQARPVLWEAWEAIVRGMADAPETEVETLVDEGGFGAPPARWRSDVGATVARAAADAYDGDPQRIARFSTGRMMALLRGKVPAAEVITAVRDEIEANHRYTAR